MDALRRWARWLRRAGDIGLQQPDPCILLKGVDLIAKKVLQEQGELQFRMNMLRYNLDLYVKPSLRSVQDYHQALLSEFEQVAFRGRSRAGTHTTATASMKAFSSPFTTTTTTATTATDDGGGGDASPHKTKAAPCKFS